jgi:hypothetical protein
LSERDAALARFDAVNNNAMSIPAGFKVLDPAGPFPADVATTKLPDGQVIPYIVRREVGVIDRAVYRIEFLHQPKEPLPTPWSHSSSGWNGKVVYAFGGGCDAGYRQGILRLGEYREFSQVLAHGYALVSSSLNILGNNCNDKISAEAAAMVKEYFIEHFGVPRYTIGAGESGGGISVHLIAQNYPGILDGIIPFWSFPDVVSSVLLPIGDCALLDRAMGQSSRSLTDIQKAAISGFAAWQVCAPRVGWLDPKTCDPSLPKELIYDRVRNPGGTRCTYYDNAVNVLGRDPKTGFARQTYDNVGVQYGLKALNAGVIDVDQFIELNQRLGGFDVDGQIVNPRSAAAAEAIRAAFAQGMLVTGTGLSNVPIIDWNPYLDDLTNSHTREHALLVKERLTEANGSADNHVILWWRGASQ